MDQTLLAGPGVEVADTALPPYEPPRVLTYRGDDILGLLGPAQACSFGHSVVVCGPTFGAPNYGAPSWADPPAGGRWDGLQKSLWPDVLSTYGQRRPLSSYPHRRSDRAGRLHLPAAPPGHPPLDGR